MKNVHWACGLFAARQKICETIDKDRAYTESAANLKEWTIPVLFTRLQLFRLRVMGDQANSPPVFRPQPVAQKPGATPTPHPGLTQKEIRAFAEELEQLIEDRERFKDLTPVVKKINARIAEIEALLDA